MTIDVRPAVIEDCSNVLALKRQLKGSSDPAIFCSSLPPEWLVENAALALVAFDKAAPDSVLGFLALYSTATHKDASPMGDLADEKSEWLIMEMEGLGYESAQVGYVKALMVSPKNSEETAHKLLHGAFRFKPAMDVVVWASPCALPPQMSGVLSSFQLSNESEIEGLFVYHATREKHLPHLTMRRAVVDDHDELLPVVERGYKRFPAFAQLPQSVNPTADFALARVIEGQDDDNLVLVGESNGKMVGMLVCTTNIDLEVVQSSFDLHAYDKLLPAEMYEAQVAHVREHVLRRKRDVAEALRMSRIHKRNQERQEENDRRRVVREEFIQLYEADYAEKFAAAEEAAKEAAKKRGRNRGKMPEPMPKDPPPPEIPEEMRDLGPDETVEPEIEVDTTEEEIRAAMLEGEVPLEPVPTASDQLCFAAIVYCLDEEFESLWQDVLQEAFDFFTTKDYCLVMLPHESKVPSMLQAFTRVPSIPTAKFPEQLYIFNRHGLIKNLEVRLAVPEDRQGVESLTAGMSNQAEILESFSSTVDQDSAVVMLVEDQVVAIATFILGVNLELLQNNFLLSSCVQMSEIPPDAHSEVDMVIINPIFAHRMRDMLVESLQILNSSVLFYALPPGAEKPDVLAEFCQVPGRTIPTAEDEAFALYCFTRRLSHVRRNIVNSQIVIIGASECGISTVEQLLCNNQVEFTSITLVAPGGITVGGAGSSYTSQDISKIGLEVQVNVVDGEMVGLDREEQIAYLSDGTALSYEVLVLSAGLQDQALKRINRSGSIDAPVVTLEELISELEEEFAQTLTSCIVYGATMEAYQAMELLVSRGCPIDCITHVTPPEGHLGPSFVVQKLAKTINLELPDTEVMTLVDLQGDEDSSLVNATFAYVDPTTMQSVTAVRHTQLLVMADAKDVDISLFECINGASLVYDGRVVVDGAFRTNDSHIFAAGTIARFSRSLALNSYQEFYNSKEIGSRLAESLCAVFGNGELKPKEVPRLGMARVVGTDLPGGGSIIYVGNPAAIAHPSLEAPLEGRKIWTSTDDGYCQLILDENMVVQSLVYAGPLQVNGSKYQGMVGIHAAYLNDLVNKYDCNLVPDLLHFLNETWSKLYHHDGFYSLRSELLSIATPMFDPKGNNDAIKAVTLDVLLAFVRLHLPELPTYSLPPSMVGGVSSTGEAPAATAPAEASAQ